MSRDKVIDALHNGYQTITEVSEYTKIPYTVVNATIRRLRLSGMAMEVEGSTFRGKRFKLTRRYYNQQEIEAPCEKEQRPHIPPRDPLIEALFGPARKINESH